MLIPTIAKMLLEIHHVTPPIAEGIAARYEHVHDLVAAFCSPGGRGGNGAGDTVLQMMAQYWHQMQRYMLNTGDMAIPTTNSGMVQMATANLP